MDKTKVHDENDVNKLVEQRAQQVRTSQDITEEQKFVKTIEITKDEEDKQSSILPAINQKRSLLQ